MKKALLTIVACAAMSTAAFAGEGEGQITFVGEIVSGACGIDSSSVDQTVSLGSVPEHVFTAAGSRSTPKSFDIKLTDCDTSIAQHAYFTFTGTSDVDVPALIGHNGSAEHVAIRLQAGSGEYLDNGSEQKGPLVLANGTSIARFAAMYEATGNSVTAGTVESVANFTVRYD